MSSYIACWLNKSDLSSIFNSFFILLFMTNNIEMVKFSQLFLVYVF